jgi:hypothetical protein
MRCATCSYDVCSDCVNGVPAERRARAYYEEDEEEDVPEVQNVQDMLRHYGEARNIASGNDEMV